MSFIDLQPWANQSLDESFSFGDPNNHLAELDKGEQNLHDATFLIGDSCIHLGSSELPELRG